MGSGIPDGLLSQYENQQRSRDGLRVLVRRPHISVFRMRISRSALAYRRAFITRHTFDCHGLQLDRIWSCGAVGYFHRRTLEVTRLQCRP
jgi:hypothetical protein